MPLDVLLVVAGYLCGSVASAIVVCSLLGLADPRAGGSGNPGATNVMRLHGRGPAALTLAGDLLKGLLPVCLARIWGETPEITAWVALAAFLGHLYPVFFGFRGGKGIATSIGVLLGLAPTLGAAFVLVWFLVARVSRYSSLAGMTAAVAMPALAVALALPVAASQATAVMAALVLWRHRRNIVNLATGREARIGERQEA